MEMFPNNIEIAKVENINSLILFKNGIINNPFMSNKRKKHFLNYNNIWKTENNNSTIYLCLPDKLKNILQWDTLLKLVFWRINFMRNIANNNNILEVWILPSNYKKILPKTKIITEDDINSGMTISNNENINGKIYIWRKEELLKVLLHELVHSFELDRNDPTPVEAYTELRALIVNIYLELLERNLPLSYFHKLYNCEKQFGLEQSKKISKCINKNTNIYYYINEKSRLLHNMNDLEWKKYLENKKIKKKLISPTSLRFTITDVILQDYPKIFK
jgi:hypothetical protein